VPELAVRCFGVVVGVHVDEPAMIPKVRDRFPPGSRESRCSPDRGFSYSVGRERAAGSPCARYRVGYRGAQPFARHCSEEGALVALESAVRLDVATAAEDWLFVHAGVVGRNGRAAVIPAPSRHGKSRLVEALVRAGADYYSDEFAVLDPRGRVHPYAKPLTLREDCGAGLRHAAAAIGGAVGVTPLAVGLVVNTRYERGRSWKPRRATLAEGVLAMFANTVRARSDPAVLGVLARALGSAVVLEGSRGEADAIARDLLSRLDEERTGQTGSGGCDAP
jgi:hypothetical protein